jgi:hypothetical protein
MTILENKSTWKYIIGLDRHTIYDNISVTEKLRKERLQPNYQIPKNIFRNHDILLLKGIAYFCTFKSTNQLPLWI